MYDGCVTTNYRDTFIQVAADCPAERAEIPPANPLKPSVAALQYELLIEHPYEFTSDEILFAVYARRASIADDLMEQERALFFGKPQACLRSSPLSKRYGWGTHHDGNCRVALVGLGTAEYDRLIADPKLAQKQAMRSAKV